MTPFRSIAFACAALLIAAGLSGCGRKGPLELPPDVQARGAALRAQEESRQEKAAPLPGFAGPKRPDPPIPGTMGHRPPEQYPFVLDPLL